MPRRRQGPPTPSQLRPPNPQAPQAPTGQPYGAAGAQLQRQQNLPLPSGPAPVVTAGPPMGGAPGSGAPGLPSPAGGAPAPGGPALPPPEPAPYTGSDLQTAARAWTPPSLGLTGPSMRPNEPITSGLSSGPGSNVVPAVVAPPRQVSTVATTLSTLAASNPSLTDLADQARAQGL